MIYQKIRYCLDHIGCLYNLISTFSELFQTDNYIKKICAEVITVLHRCHASIRNDVSCSLEFISRLLAKLSITGYSG